MALYKGAQKNLASTSYSDFINSRFSDRICWNKCGCSIYLHVILISMKASRNDHEKTMLTISIGFLVIFVIINANWALIVSLVVGLIGVFSTFLSRQIDFLWRKLAWVLSLIMPNIILSIVFFLLLFPTALLSRLFRKGDLLQLKNTSPSTFIATNREFSKEYFEKPW